MAGDFRSRAPWGTEPGLKQKAQDVGVDFDQFISGLAHEKTDTELAGEFGVTPGVIAHLRDHFERMGIHSIMGQD